MYHVCLIVVVETLCTQHLVLALVRSLILKLRQCGILPVWTAIKNVSAMQNPGMSRKFLGVVPR